MWLQSCTVHYSNVLCGVRFISVVEPQFLLYMWRKQQRFLVTDLIIYIYIYICLMCFIWSARATEKDTTQHGYMSVTVVFISFVTVSCICVERNKTFRYAYQFIRKCCVFHMCVTIAVGNGRSVSQLLRCRVHIAAQGRERETFQVSKEPSAVCS